MLTMDVTMFKQTMLWRLRYVVSIAVAAFAVLTIVAVGELSTPRATALKAIMTVAVIATLLLWLRNRFALYAWACFFAAYGIGKPFFPQPYGNAILFWSTELPFDALCVWVAVELCIGGWRVTHNKTNMNANL